MPFSTFSPLTTILNVKFKKALHQVFLELLSTLLKWLISLTKLVRNSVHSLLLFWTLKTPLVKKFIIIDYHHIPDHIKSLVKSLYTDFKTSILTNAFRISWTIDRQVYFQAKAKTYIIHLKPPARRFHFLILPSLQVENKYKITLHNKNHVFFCRSCFMKSLNS